MPIFVGMNPLKLYMVMLGCKPRGRHTEQHDVFFGIAESLKELAPQIRAFWPEPEKIHIDAWREVNSVDGYQVCISQKDSALDLASKEKLFFINLGGYQENKFEEQHYILLTVQEDMAAASKNAKATLFFKHNRFDGANAHIDDKYGIDVDDIYPIEDMLPITLKETYSIILVPTSGLPDDTIHLGYLKLQV